MRNITTIIFSSMVAVAVAQTGSKHAFDFLQLPAHARLAALGGVNVSLADRDVDFFLSNPSLAGDTLNGSVSAGYQFYLAGIGNALFSAAYDVPKVGQMLLGIQHVDYGTIHGFDASGAETLDYTSGETAIVLAKSHQVGNMRFGIALKGAFSNIAGYKASALTADLGGIFKHPRRDFTAGLAIKNIGMVLSRYTPGSSVAVPLDVQAGVTFKPQYMPLRFSLTAWHLVQENVPGTDNIPDDERPSALRNVLSHLNLGAEILLHRNVNLMVGYNYLLRQALKMETGVSPAGLSYGFSLLVRPVEFVFSRNPYTAGNAGYSFTLSTNVNHFLKKVKL